LTKLLHVQKMVLINTVISVIYWVAGYWFDDREFTKNFICGWFFTIYVTIL